MHKQLERLLFLPYNQRILTTQRQLDKSSDTKTTEQLLTTLIIL